MFFGGNNLVIVKVVMPGNKGKGFIGLEIFIKRKRERFWEVLENEQG
jgi:hypothetical protein